MTHTSWPSFSNIFYKFPRSYRQTGTASASYWNILCLDSVCIMLALSKYKKAPVELEALPVFWCERALSKQPRRRKTITVLFGSFIPRHVPPACTSHGLDFCVRDYFWLPSTYEQLISIFVKDLRCVYLHLALQAALGLLLVSESFKSGHHFVHALLVYVLFWRS